MPMPTLQQIIGTITGKVAFERTQANFTTIKDAHDALETNLTTHKAESVQLKEVHGLRYEEGNWTPVLVGSTVAGSNNYSVQIGKYIKLNKQVTCYGEINLSSKDANMAGGVRITGLPFAVGGGAFNASMSIGRLAGVTFTLGYYITGMPINTTARVDMYENNNVGATPALVQAGALGNATSIRFTLTYMTN